MSAPHRFESPRASAEAASPLPAELRELLDAKALAALAALDPYGSGQFLLRVLRTFDGATQRLLVQLEAAQAAADAQQLRYVAHTLKSSAASIGALRLSQLSAEAETLVRDGDVDAALHGVPELLAECRLVLTALRALPAA